MRSDRSGARETLSIVTHFLNAAESLPAFRRRVTQVAAHLRAEHGVEVEVVLVDDHSTDDSSQFAKRWQREDKRVVYLRLSRTCGSHAAASAGLQHCRGDYAVVMAADLQDPPELIRELWSKSREGYDVVWAVRAQREGESWSTKFLAGLYYGLMRRVALPNMPARGADFLLLNRQVIEACNAIPEKNTSLLAMILWMGFRQASIEYVKQSRHAGASKWTLAKKLKLFSDSIVSFSYTPIRAMSYLGLVMACAGFCYAGAVIAGRLCGWITSGTGFAALMTVLLVGQGVIMTMLGILGEYVWRAFDEVRGRPRYLLEEQLPSPRGARPYRAANEERPAVEEYAPWQTAEPEHEPVWPVSRRAHRDDRGDLETAGDLAAENLVGVGAPRRTENEHSY